MPKRTELKPDEMAGLFKKTERDAATSADLSDLDEGRIQSTGVGLRTSEIAVLDDLGRQLGDHMNSAPVARNALIRISVRRLIAAVRAGEITLADLADKFERPEKPRPKFKP